MYGIDLYTEPFFCAGWGRPSDVEFLSDGSMLISDQDTNAIYRISYTPSSSSSSGLSMLTIVTIIVAIVLITGALAWFCCRDRV
jgi:hypothetical protein